MNTQGSEEITDKTAKILLPLIYLPIILSVVSRIPFLLFSRFGSDEFEHLHRAFSFYHGGLPYHDYVEIHTPLIQFLLTPLFPLFGESIALMFSARVLMLVFYLGILYLTYKIAKAIYDRWAGIFSVLLLSYMVIFYDKGVEVRPDVPATFFWLLSLLFIIKGVVNKRARYFIVSGLSIGISLMFTQKAFITFLGLCISWAFLICHKGIDIDQRKKWRFVWLFLISSILPGVIVVLFFLLKDSLRDLLYSCIYINATWERKFWPFKYLRWSIDENAIFWILGLAGLITAVVRLIKRNAVYKSEFNVLFPLLMLISGLFIIPVPHQQYYLLFIPLMAIYAGYIFNVITKWYFNALKNERSLGQYPLILLIMILSGIGFISISLFHDIFRGQAIDFGIKAQVVFFLGFIFLYIGLRRWPRLQRYIYILILIGVLLQPSLLIIKKLHGDNLDQLEYINFIMNNTSPEDTIMDGFSGLSLFRPHASYYFYLHPSIIRTYGEKVVLSDIQNILLNNPPRAVIFDRHIRALPQYLRDLIMKKYTPTEKDDIWLLNPDFTTTP